MSPVEIEREWMALRGDRIVAKGGTKEQARRAAEHLGREYLEVVAMPKGGVHGVY